MAVMWNALLGAPDPGQAFLQGMQQGEARRLETQKRNALQEFAKDPDSPNAMNALITADPELGLKYMGVQNERAKIAATQQKQRHEELRKTVGQAAFDVMSRPPEQRAAAWDAYVEHFAKDDPEAIQYKGQYSDQAAMALMAQAGLTQDYQKAQEPRIMPVQPGGYVAAMDRDGGNARYIVAPEGRAPSAPPQGAQPADAGFVDFDGAGRLIQSMGPQGFVQWQQQHRAPVQVQSQQQRDALPSGAQYVAPDGSLRTKN